MVALDLEETSSLAFTVSYLILSFSNVLVEEGTRPASSPMYYSKGGCCVTKRKSRKNLVTIHALETQGSNVALDLSSQCGVVYNPVTFAWLISGRKVNIAKVVLHLRLARAG